MSMEKVVRSTGKEFRLVNYHWLAEAIFYGVLLQLKFFEKMVDDNPGDYVNSILLVKEIMEEQFVTTVNFTRNENRH